MDRTAALLDQLARYEPADELEWKCHRDMTRLLSASSDPFSRMEFDPGHITASVFILDQEGRLLLHHHRRLGRWLQMGGHLEPGEMPVDAAMREGSEESGLSDLRVVGEGALDLDVHDIPAGKGEPAHHHFDVRYLARTSRPQSIIIDSSESLDLVWVTLEQAESLMAAPESSRVIRKITRVLCAS
ncbi:MAG TPA: NUDIX domain-containing protein [Thermoanaerobaculia bacterium]|nr:NUDIX domain-containing protein [Thermoanaerobaculia bacterium]